MINASGAGYFIQYLLLPLSRGIVDVSFEGKLINSRILRSLTHRFSEVVPATSLFSRLEIDCLQLARAVSWINLTIGLEFVQAGLSLDSRFE